MVPSRKTHKSRLNVHVSTTLVTMMMMMISVARVERTRNTCFFLYVLYISNYASTTWLCVCIDLCYDFKRNTNSTA